MKKIGVWQFDLGTVRLYNADVSDTLLRESGDVVSFLGYIEVEEPKKTVTKTVTLFSEWRLQAESIRLPYPVIPVGAKNVRLQFDVEE